jgi:hypothetical protein
VIYIVIDKVPVEVIINSIRPQKSRMILLHFCFLAMATGYVQVFPLAYFAVEFRIRFRAKMVNCVVCVPEWITITVGAVILRHEQQLGQQLLIQGFSSHNRPLKRISGIAFPVACISLPPFLPFF